MPYLARGGKRLFYVENGVKGAGLALLLVHGAGGSHEDWPASFWHAGSWPGGAGLSGWPVYALDLPGHGRSDPPAQEEIAGYASAVAELAAALALEQVVVAGHSMGAAIALTLGLRRPPWLAGLVLLGGGAQMPVSPALLEGLANDFPATIDLIVRYAWHRQADSAVKEQARQRLRQLPPSVVLGDYKACSRFDASLQLREIDLPVLVIGAGEDRMMPAKHSQFLAHHLPQAELALVEHAGHFMTVEQPAVVARLVAGFLSRLRGQGTGCRPLHPQHIGPGKAEDDPFPGGHG